MGGGLCVLRAGGQRPGAAGERTGAVRRRCLPGDAWAQPVDPAAAGSRWVDVTPAGMECGGGADRRANVHEMCSQTIHRRRVH
jgi:hypothetical protein